QQAEVWKAELNLHRYEYERNLKAVMSLWDDKFVGWPDYERRPVRKREIEASYVDEFKTEPTPKQPFVAPTPEAIEVFGDIAITHYFWPEADLSSPDVFRITHTWRKGPDGWRIIGGMSCAVPRATSGNAISTTTN